MSRNLLPFLYQTRTLQLAFRRPATILFTQKAGVATETKRPRRIDNSIPFEFDDEEQANAHASDIEQEGTLTPSETEIFKSIFDDISHARLPQNKKPQLDQQQPREAYPSTGYGAERRSGNTLVEKARGANFSEDFLKRYPSSLRRAAENALGKFELAPKRPNLYNMTELDKAEKKQLQEWAKYESLRELERSRVEKLMQDCQTDAELWEVLEKEVFSLPEKLGIHEQNKTAQKIRKLKKKARAQDNEAVMDVHGYLYSHYLNYGLNLLDTGFPKPSILAFNILPRIKELGLSSYVLGVSTPLFIKLAEIHWKRYGDATSAFDVLDEMKPLGLFPTEKLGELEELIEQISDHLHSCTWGAQGPFVMAMMQAPPFDATLTSRLGRMKGLIAKKQFYNERDGRGDDEI
ncbi:hypothetical protein HG530_011041 [Fusarium avenaceum]|nr:hypothetical protein DER45DRAFT_571209 [Fusarium avenaceum]KAI6758801.1 hypothetical protein HG530_011041 [Fusarium avenaceum]